MSKLLRRIKEIDTTLEVEQQEQTQLANEALAEEPVLSTAVMTDQGLFIGSESSFYRVLHLAGRCHRRGRAQLPQEPRSIPRLRADGPKQVWSWDISFLPTTVRGVWLYLYLVVDVWSRKAVAWDVAEVETADIAADLVQRACLRERYHRTSGFASRQCKQPPLNPPRRQRQCLGGQWR